MKKYIFPLNYDYSNKFLGIFEYRILTPFVIFGFVLARIISGLDIGMYTSINVFILTYFPLFLIANTTVYKEPLVLFLCCIIRHYIKAGKYVKNNKICKLK